jgi:hypothetical protein
MSTEIQVPPRVFSKDYDDVSSLNSDVSLISSPRKSRMTKNSKLWRVYLPSIAIIFILTSAVVAYAMHSFFKRVPEPTVDVQGNSSPTAKNELVRRFDSTNGLSKRGSPLNSMEVGVYITCESRLDELLPFDFVNTQCSMCSKDFGIVSSRVMNLCIASQMITPIEKEVCKWPGMKCNEHGDIVDFMIKSSVAVDFIPSIEYLVAVESC